MEDLFDKLTAAAPPFGIKVKLDPDSERPCCDNVVVLRPTTTMHAGELRCARWHPPWVGVEGAHRLRQSHGSAIWRAR